MKFYALIILILIVNSVCASDVASKKIIGKPGVPAYFSDKEIINLAVGETRRIDLPINYSADLISYELQATDGLDVRDLKQSFIREDVVPHSLVIPLEINVNQPGRYYLHLRITTSTQGVETKGVLSKIISSESGANESVQKKNVTSKQFRILPVVETVKDAEDE
jgi:hypothetical protein